MQCVRSSDFYDDHSFAFGFERSFEFCDWQPWMRQFYLKNITFLIAGYIIAVFGIRNYMRDRKPFDLQRPLIAWNSALALFSIIGTIRTFPELFSVWQDEGFDGTICNASGKSGATGLWSFLFVLSKVPEFLDTIFIVLRKKPLIFLHYYHHIETCWFALFSYPYMLPAARWAIVMNYAVHSVMYTYYALRAAGYRLPNAFAMAITTAQCVQMFVGVVVGFKLFFSDCGTDHTVMKAAFATYLIYAFLFSHYFYKSYFSKSSRRYTSPDANNNARCKAE